MTRAAEVHDIEGVLAALRRVVDGAARAGDRIGLFAAVYRQVTAAVAQQLGRGFFDDDERLSRFDAVFADRYLSALAAWRDGRDPGRSWRLAFRATEDAGPVLVQHVLLGVNAHINLDLAVAAAQTSPGEEIGGLKGDFDRVNQVLLDVLCRLQGTLDELSPLLARPRRRPGPVRRGDPRVPGGAGPGGVLGRRSPAGRADPGGACRPPSACSTAMPPASAGPCSRRPSRSPPRSR